MTMTLLPVTLATAAGLGLINLWISFRIVRMRLKDDILIGDGGEELLAGRMRAHANLVEYAPFVLILMALIELSGGAHFVLVGAGDDPAAIVAQARTLCPGERFCQVYGWSEASAIPSELPLSNEARRQLRFSYLAPRNGNPEAVFFDCRLFAQPATGRCLPAARP